MLSSSPADAAGGKQEPVHKDPGAVIVWVVGQQSVPLVSLLARAVSGAARRAFLSEGWMWSGIMTTDCPLPADLLVYRLLKLLVVEDGPHLAVAVACPEGGHNLDWRLTHILSGKFTQQWCWNVNCWETLLSATVFYWPRVVGLSFVPAVHCSVVLCTFIMNII